MLTIFQDKRLMGNINITRGAVDSDFSKNTSLDHSGRSDIVYKAYMRKMNTSRANAYVTPSAGVQSKIKSFKNNFCILSVH